MAQHLWRDVAAPYDRSFATLCAGTVPWLLDRVPHASSVLDVGCGSGHLTAALVAAGHDVDPVDPDPEMVALTTRRAGVPARAGALPSLPVADASAGVVVANFVLNHVDDPAAAAAGLARAVRLGGRVLATIWPGRPGPHGVLWGEVLDQAGAVRPDVPRLAPELDFERSPEGLAGLVAGAGLSVLDARELDWTWQVAPEDLWVGATSVGNFGVTWRAQDAGAQERMRAVYTDLVESRLEAGLLRFAVECVLVEAVRAER